MDAARVTRYKQLVVIVSVMITTFVVVCLFSSWRFIAAESYWFAGYFAWTCTKTDRIGLRKAGPGFSRW